jgi:hypothetical protein
MDYADYSDDTSTTDVTDVNTNNDKKNITILGTNNRYLIKRANRVKNEVKKREIMNKYNILPQFLDFNKQIEMIKDIYLKRNEYINIREKSIIIQELDKKIKCYKQQDIIKKLYNELELVTTQTIFKKLVDCNMLCFYCNCQVYVLYENVRELNQWTVDRIDNSLGHNNNNFVISCLNCNIKRRNLNSDKFLFTKQLNLVKIM